ncbi:MAG TPA: hypothetical protein PKW18_01870 [Candidatus Sumerlaeota bacterium]|nr:MAG: hypothetical protein BWY12_00288 [candidate division BRC1 bacterium ADurb.Bin183]HOE62191.1 hypothetical protein [Candidatus Sumerlaeota bacterium]HRR32219.1 hypothetical protein [Candidatus Sumerlaeia bacterium]HON49106.1 hypothetical protein [Candidatus Sumerlaeota bacterium]HOR64287.1 hypothetical protein [Candidatus Sumerlaeota bacterium]
MKRADSFHQKSEHSSKRQSVWTLCALFAAILLFGAGCSKQLANLSLNKAKKLIMEAERREAGRLEKENLDAAKREVEEAERLIAENRAKQARARASSAVANAKKTLENTLSKLAAQRINEAKTALDVANLNHGASENQERYNNIKTLFDKAQEKQRKNKWADAIDLSEKEMSEVDTLLARLLNEAKQKQMAAQSKFDELKHVGAEQYANEYVLSVQDMLRNIENKITVERDYLGARNQADDAIRKSEDGIIATKGKMAYEQLSILEDGLAEAQGKGALIHAKDLLKSCEDSFDTILKQYSEKKYDMVIESAKILGPKVQKLIYTTRLKSAEAKINIVVAEIDKLKEGGATQYLPGRVETMEESLNDARAKFQEEKFEECEEVCVTALREGEKIHAAFNDLALDAMRNAAESLEIARNVFDKMGDIFIIRSDMKLSGLNLQFENKKQAIQMELDTILKNARLTLGIAKLRQEEQKYRKAIEISGEVKQSGEYVLNETYHVVAHNAIMELSEQVTRRETDGARQYVPAELDRTQVILEQAKKLLAGGEYKEAVRRAGEARAQLEITTQELAQKAVENMALAKRQIEDSRKNRTDEFQKSELERAQALLADADKALQDQKLKPAVETALQAANVAQEASIRSAKIWCEQVIAEAESAIKNAEEAGALIYAGEQLDESKRFLNSSQNLYQSGNYLEGKDVAQRAVQKARDAFYKNILAAETAINEAKSYNGWEHRSSLLSQAIVDAKLARQNIDAGDYFRSSAYAEKAAIEAHKVVKDTKNVVFQKRIREIMNSLDVAMHSGVNYFQAEEAKKIFRQVAALKEKYSLNNYDEISSELDKIEADMERTLATTPLVLENMIAKQQQRLANAIEAKVSVEIAADLINRAKDQLHYSKIDFDNKKFTLSYRELKNAVAALDEIESRIAMEDYAEQANEILESLDEALDGFQSVLSLGPKAVESFSRGPNKQIYSITVLGGMAPDQFRNTVSELYEKARLIEFPPDAELVHANFVDMINDIRLASIYFDKMIILSEFDAASRHEIIYKAFDYINSAKQKRAELQKTLLVREKKMRLADGRI